MIICVIFDQAVGSYGNPFSFRNRPDAVRTFINEIRRPESGVLHQNRHDFCLMHVADYDETAGLITGVPADVICHGKDVALEDPAAH